MVNKIIFFDTETTGLPLDYNIDFKDKEEVLWASRPARLVELAYEVWEVNEKPILKKSKSVIVKPSGFSIPTGASQVHGISNAKAKEVGISLKKAVSDFANEITENTLLVAHNVNFDKIIMAGEFYRSGIDVKLLDNTFCTMLSSADYVKSYWNDYYQSWKWPTLQELADWCEIELPSRSENDRSFHSALYDVEVMSRCFFSEKFEEILKDNKMKTFENYSKEL